MKKIVYIFIMVLALAWNASAQETGYYNNTDGLSGDELKSALNDIIQDHIVYDYYSSKTAFKTSDADPDNPDNIILVYTGRSNVNNDYGTGGDYVNREHVWAKSHGGFGTESTAGSDYHNLKPADASVNVSRSNKDFDNGGTQHEEATGCYTDSDSWEPRDEVKGDIARIIFYMATRYEGENGEPDLQVVDQVSTYPNAQHGKLSTLLEWNQMDAPDDFERNRNNVIFSWQQNRNPFIDNPDFADLIWNNASADGVNINEITIAEEINDENPTNISANITASSGNISSAIIKWGTTYSDLNQQVSLSQSGDNFSGQIPVQTEGTTIYYAIEATNGTDTDMSIVYTFYVAPTFNGELVTIYDIQGQTDLSPMADQIQDATGTQELGYGEVSTSGVVTGTYGDKYFIQDGYGEWNGVLVYDNGRNPSVGDSVIITGIVKEYYEVTEITEISGYYHIQANKPLPQPIIINSGDAEEKYEGCLIRVEDAQCTSSPNTYAMWQINDGSGSLYVHNTSVYTFNPSVSSIYTVTGPLNYDFEEFKIELRTEADVLTSEDTEAPTIQSLEATDETTIVIYFDEYVDETTSENFRNYSLDNDVEVEEAIRHILTYNKITLTVSPLTAGTTYTLTIDGVKDLTGNVTDNLTYTFGYLTGIEEYVAEDSFKIYPNPVNQSLFVELNATQDTKATLTILSGEGRNVYESNVEIIQGANTILIPANHLNTGIYMLKLTLDEGVIVRKFMKH